MKSLYVWIILVVFTLIVLSPLLYHMLPPYLFSPDIQFLKGKVLRVMEGDFYTDPVTGFPTFHPPYYYCVLVIFVMIGFDINYAIFIVIICTTFLSVFFMYKLLVVRHGKETALYAVLILPLITEYINNMNLLLASAFYFSIPFFLAGLWLFCREETKYKFTIGYALLWALAFIISPGYLFLIGLLLFWELLIRRRPRHFLTAAGTILVALIPFYIQGYVIFSNNMFGTAAFSFWPGLPDLEFLSSLTLTSIAPGGHRFTQPIVWGGLIALIWGGGVLVKTGNWRNIIIAVAIAYFLTLFHYLPQYAARIYLYLLILVVPLGVQSLLEMRRSTSIGRAVIFCFVALGFFYHYSDLIRAYRGQEIDLAFHRESLQAQVINQLYTNTRPDDFILVSSENYRLNVLPYVPVHALRAWRSGEYYQLKTAISDRMDADYDSLMQCTDTACVNHFCDRYNMRVALLYRAEELDEFPVFRVVDEYWKAVYNDVYFRIYLRR